MSFESDDLISSDDESDVSDDEFNGPSKNIKNYTWEKSDATFQISEVLGIVVGGASSRFWLLRKHINTIEYDKLGK